MRVEMLWAGVAFTALGGRTEALLQASAEQHFHLRKIFARPGGFRAQCTARAYLRLFRLARRYHVHLHICRRSGVFFGLRPLIRRTGLWVGVLVFGILLLFSRQLIWDMKYVDLSAGQQARAEAVLRQCGLERGERVLPQMLTEGETELVESGEFGWASLNFAGGRLTVEAAPAVQVPPIEQNRYTDIHAKAAGTVTAMDIKRGNAAVSLGQSVAAGQVLIAAARTDRKGRPVAGRTEGSVEACFLWSYETSQPLVCTMPLPRGNIQSQQAICCLGRAIKLPGRKQQTDGEGQMHQHHEALTFLGMALPATVYETECIPYKQQTVTRTESLALDLARLAAKRERYRQWPDAKVIATQESSEIREGMLYYVVRQQVEANICD